MIAAICATYGWPADDSTETSASLRRERGSTEFAEVSVERSVEPLAEVGSDEEILARLLALNLARIEGLS